MCLKDILFNLHEEGVGHRGLRHHAHHLEILVGRVLEGVLVLRLERDHLGAVLHMIERNE